MRTEDLGEGIVTSQLLGDLILWLIALAVAVVIGVYLLRWLYRRLLRRILQCLPELRNCRVTSFGVD